MTDFAIVNIGSLSMNRFWGETERRRQPTATCTLVVTAGQRLLVDPSPHSESLAPVLFANAGLQPGQIDLVFVTHHHADHRFGLSMFPGRPWLMASAGLEEWRHRSPDDHDIFERFIPAEGNLPAGVDLLPTPGHTLSHHSLAFESAWGVVVVAGDAVMTREFFAAGEGFHNSADSTQAGLTIRRIKLMADVVVPGHGNFLLNRRP